MLKQILQIYATSGIVLYGLAATSSVRASPEGARPLATSASRIQPLGKNLTTNPALDLIFSRRWYFYNPIELLKPICSADRGSTTNTFIFTGRGGLPPNPRQILSSNAVQVEWVELDGNTENRARDVESRGARRSGRSSTTLYNTVNITRPPTEILEAKGWVTGANGDVTLVATAPTAMPYSSWQTLVKCREVGRK